MQGFLGRGQRASRHVQSQVRHFLGPRFLLVERGAGYSVHGDWSRGPGKLGVGYEDCVAQGTDLTRMPTQWACAANLSQLDFRTPLSQVPSALAHPHQPDAYSK